MLGTLRLALAGVWRAKLRSALTVLGILIGIAAVVVVTALTTGARQVVGNQIESLGSNLLFIFSQPTARSGARVAALGLTEDDALAIRREASAVSKVTVYSDVRVQVVSEIANDSIQVVGADASYFSVRGFSVEGGRMWTASEGLVKAKVCLIGQTAIRKLFGGVDPIGRFVRVGKHPFRVIGTLKSKGDSPFEDQDDRIIMPIGSWRSRVRPTSGRRVQLIMAKSKSSGHTAQAVRQIDGILRQRHRIDDGEEADFRVRTQEGFKKRQDAVFGALTALLLSVAAVSLFVGGVGVMNIMLVSVAERTREIGIRMAIGARKLDIQLQFLAEAVVLTLLGGGLGILAALGLATVLSQATGWEMPLSGTAVGIAVTTSLLVGFVFGFLPARRAANLDPIEALRHE